MLPEHEPDNVEKGIRFGCGFIFGIVFAVYTLLQELTSLTGSVFCAIVAGIALAMGFLAMKFGDDFWREVIGKWK